MKKIYIVLAFLLTLTVSCDSASTGVIVGKSVDVVSTKYGDRTMWYIHIQDFNGGRMKLEAVNTKFKYTHLVVGDTVYFKGGKIKPKREYDREVNSNYYHNMTYKKKVKRK